MNARTAALIGALSFAHGAWANPALVNLPADTWYRVQNSKLLAAAPPTNELERKGIHCVLGPAGVVLAWSGGAYDARRHRMIVWGGGHADYCGNEVYAFDLGSLRWERLTEPSLPPFDREVLSDGRPVSRHTYDGLQYLTHADRFWAYGGSRAVDGGGTRATWVFDFASKRWTSMESAGAPTPGSGSTYNLSSAYDPVSRQIFMRDATDLYAYDFDKNAWKRLLNWTHTSGQQRSAVDTKRRLYLTIGSGEFLAYDIDAGRDLSRQWATKGGEDITAAPAPGVDYDSKADALVAWKGGAVQVLDMQTKVWAKKSGVGAPASQVGNGTFGRWRYVPEFNVFILVNSAADDVYFYKHTAGGGPPVSPAAR